MQRIMSKKILCGTLALATLAGIATTASADECCRWELRVKRKAVLSDNFEVELWAHFPDSGHAFAGGRLDILSDDIDWISHGFCGFPTGPGSSAGTLSATGDVEDIIVGQVHFPPAGVFADDANPIRVWCGEFEASGGAFRTLSTDTDSFTYYVSETSTVTTTCPSVKEASRTVFVGPIVFPGWIAVAFDGTIGTPRGDSLLLEAESTAVGEVGAALTAEDAPWAPGTRFEHAVGLGGLPDGAPVRMTWYPWWLCGPWLGETLSASMVKSTVGGATVVEVTPDFRDVGVPRVPMQLLRSGRVIEEPILGSGASFRLFNPCFSLTWCYVLNQFDQLVLALKCDDEFDVEVGGRRYTVDTIMLDPGVAPGGAGGLDRVEVVGRGVRSMTIVDAGFVGGGCRADCNGDGELNIFDFLCFQNLFASSDPGADFDGDGRLTIFDFLAFQNEFTTGCE
jgi:hypothetical protein